MKFNEEETKLLIIILNSILENLNIDTESKVSSLQNLIDKISQGEYIRGRLLNFLQTEITSSNFNCNAEQEIVFVNVLKRIKFKATPR